MRRSLDGARRHICWISDSPDTPSGFGNVTRAVCTGLAARGYRVSILGWQTREPGWYEGCQVFPIGRDALGGDALFNFLVRHRPDAVISLADVWWLPYMSSPHVKRQMELIDAPWALYFPIDGTRADGSLPPSWVELLAEVDYPIAMTRFGQRAAKESGIGADYIAHGVDVEVFSPPPSRSALKAELGLDGRFLVLSDSRNQPRKLLHRLLEIFSRLVAAHPSAMLHLHTDPDDEFARSAIYSYDVLADIAHLGLTDHVRFSPGFAMRRGAGLSSEQLARYYRAADAHLLASSGEGFGLPTLQAAAAGAVPVAVDYSANPELLADHGEPIPVQDWLDNEFGIRRALIDVDAAADALGRLCDDPSRLAEQSARSRQFALQYSWETIVEEGDALLAKMCTPSQSSRRRIAPRPDEVVRMTGGDGPGRAISVTMLRRQAGRLEASIMADARAADSILRCPTVPPACEISHVKVPREPGLICVAEPDLEAFLSLRAIFPVLHCFVPLQPGAEEPPMPESLLDSVEYAVYEVADELRYRLSRAVLLLDSASALPPELLEDAALFGLPAVVGAGPGAPCFWPAGRGGDVVEVVSEARALLTNPVLSDRLSAASRQLCRGLVRPDEEAIADTLRAQHRLERAALAAVEA